MQEILEIEMDLRFGEVKCYFHLFNWVERLLFSLVETRRHFLASVKTSSDAVRAEPPDFIFSKY